MQTRVFSWSGGVTAFSVSSKRQVRLLLQSMEHVLSSKGLGDR